MPLKRIKRLRSKTIPGPVQSLLHLHVKRKQWSNESMLAALHAIKEGMSINRAAVQYGVPRTTLNDHHLGKVMQLTDKPGQVYNVDETGMPLDHRPPKVLAVKGQKKVRYCTSGNKSQITVIGCVNATGTAIPPFVIFDAKSLNIEWTEGEVPGTTYGLSDRGWVDIELFKGWFNNHFLRYAVASRSRIMILRSITRVAFARRKLLDGVQGIQCESGCDHWYHAQCVGIESQEYEAITESESIWEWPTCNPVGLPAFNSVDAVNVFNFDFQQNLPTPKQDNSFIYGFCGPFYLVFIQHQQK